MHSETITLKREDVMNLIRHYADAEQRGKDLTAKAKTALEAATTDKERNAHRVIYEMYLYQTGKEAGSKEAYEEIIFKVDGKFPRTADGKEEPQL